MKERVPDLLLEQLHLGELPSEQAADVRARLAAEPGGTARLQALQADDEAALREHPPEVMAQRIRTRIDALESDAPGLQWPRWTIPAAVAVAAAALLVLVLPGGDPPAPHERSADPGAVGHGERIKGSAAIVVERQRGGAAEPLKAHDIVSPGDMLQVSYRAGEWTHGVLVSLDGAGVVTLHFPQTQQGTTDLQPEGTAVLHGFELDDAPRFERFLFYVADAPLDPAQVVRHVEALSQQPDARTAPADLSAAKAVIDLTLDRRERATSG